MLITAVLNSQVCVYVYVYMCVCVKQQVKERGSQLAPTRDFFLAAGDIKCKIAHTSSKSKRVRLSLSLSLCYTHSHTLIHTQTHTRTDK